MDLRDFGQRIMPNAHGQFCKLIALNVLKGAVMKTPVDTGLARGNWQVVIDSPPKSQIDNKDKTGDDTLAKGSSTIGSSKPMKEVIWISNNVPYIEALEDGRSKQAPIGMLELTLQEIKSKATANVI